MPRFRDIINPPTEETVSDPDQLYRNMDSVYQFLDGMITVSNPSQIINSNFSTLSAQGTSPTTQANGDNFEFVGNWFVVGATEANYTLTPTPYPTNSPIISASPYFMLVDVASYSGTGLYFYQRQAQMVRKFQTQFVTLTINATNNTADTIPLRFNINFFLDPLNVPLEGGLLYLKSGFNQLSTTLKTPNLNDQTVGAGAYIEFQLSFTQGGASNFNLDVIKGEFGKISTPLN